MKKNIFFLTLFFFINLNVFSQIPPQVPIIKQPKEVVVTQFDKILDSLKVNGSILIYDPKKETYFSNNFNWAKTGIIPASTFKIPNSIIALETGVVKNDSIIFKWNGEKRAFKKWEEDLTFKKAFQVSCVPCYQEIARKIGFKRMKTYLKKIGYPKMDFDSKTIDDFWLKGESKISQKQQIEFLKQFYYSELPISKRTEIILKDIMQIQKTNESVLSGKTGWGMRGEKDNGWIVGYLETKNTVYFFATNIEPQEQNNTNDFASKRINATKEAFRNLKILK
jgi:beta-lactamase class D